MASSISCEVNAIHLGDRPLGTPFAIDAYLHSLSPLCLNNISLNIVLDHEFFYSDHDLARELTLDPYEVAHESFIFVPRKLTNRPMKISFILLVKGSGDYKYYCKREVYVRSIFELCNSSPIIAKLGKWKYNSQAAFVWRGDIDAFIPGDGQDQNGLEHARSLIMRYHIPSTLFISGRLCLDHSEWLQFTKHYGYCFNNRDLDLFLQYLREYYSPVYESEYPKIKYMPTAIEFGNHMYLHYYNISSACAENNWHKGAIPGQFLYSWERSKRKNSLTEQKDNCIRNQQLIKEKLGFEPKTYAAPFNRCDEYTAKAIEEAGITISSAACYRPSFSKTYRWKNVPFLRNIMRNLQDVRDPYHPAECKHLVECGVIDGDPREYVDVLKLIMTLRIAIKRHSQIVLLTHHHLNSHIGNAGIIYFESFIRYLLLGAGSAFWITTLSALGDWWESVNCRYHRKITVKLDVNKTEVTVNNKSCHTDGIPVVVKFNDGKLSAFLVRCDERSSSRIKLSAN